MMLHERLRFVSVLAAASAIMSVFISLAMAMLLVVVAAVLALGSSRVRGKASAIKPRASAVLDTLGRDALTGADKEWLERVDALAGIGELDALLEPKTNVYRGGVVAEATRAPRRNQTDWAERWVRGEGGIVSSSLDGSRVVNFGSRDRPKYVHISREEEDEALERAGLLKKVRDPDTGEVLGSVELRHGEWRADGVRGCGCVQCDRPGQAYMYTPEYCPRANTKGHWYVDWSARCQLCGTWWDEDDRRKCICGLKHKPGQCDGGR